MQTQEYKEEARTPLHLMFDMAKDEIEQNVIEIMQNNQIPSGLMVYILKSVLLDVTEMKVTANNNEFVKIQELLKKEGD